MGTLTRGQFFGALAAAAAAAAAVGFGKMRPKPRLTEIHLYFKGPQIFSPEFERIVFDAVDRAAKRVGRVSVKDR